MKKLILTQRVDYIEEYGEYRDAIDQNLIKLIRQLKCLPYIIPNNLFSKKDSDQEKIKIINFWISNTKPSGIILSGGNDLGEYSSRDATELLLLEYAKNNKMPVLGICRGMQLMAQFFGTGLVKVKNHVGAKNSLKFKKNTLFPEIVKCFHNYAISSCPKGFKINARSEDGNIEAISHNSLPFEGFMWHPEREYPFLKEDIIRIKKLFKIIN